jgi:hypothetical protein
MLDLGQLPTLFLLIYKMANHTYVVKTRVHRVLVLRVVSPISGKSPIQVDTTNHPNL